MKHSAKQNGTKRKSSPKKQNRTKYDDPAEKRRAQPASESELESDNSLPIKKTT